MKDVEDLAIPLPMLQKSTFVVRLNRFVGEITLDGKLYRAHVPSSGRMKELLYPGAKVYVSANATEGGKTSHRIVLAECNGHLVSIDSLSVSYIHLQKV